LEAGPFKCQIVNNQSPACVTMTPLFCCISTKRNQNARASSSVSLFLPYSGHLHPTLPPYRHVHASRVSILRTHLPPQKGLHAPDLTAILRLIAPDSRFSRAIQKKVSGLQGSVMAAPAAKPSLVARTTPFSTVCLFPSF
jgi:hypothetical protein